MEQVADGASDASFADPLGGLLAVGAPAAAGAAGAHASASAASSACNSTDADNSLEDDLGKIMSDSMARRGLEH
eukprot:7599804-Alexandrium_andersonii.AAC.1